MAQLHSFYVLVLVFHALLAGAQQFTVQEEGCPKATRPHMTRCDQYYRCTVLSKDAHVWVATQCQKGLVYLHKLGTCVVPGEYCCLHTKLGQVLNQPSISCAPID